MNVDEFIGEWKLKKDADDSEAVGIGINWSVIPEDSKVIQFCGQCAWEKIKDFYTPIWGHFDRTTLGGWLNPDRHDYQRFIGEEKVKIEFYEVNGLVYPEFCAFADATCSSGILGDGNHRFIDCNYLMIVKGKDLTSSIERCRLDVLCLPNLHEVISEQDLPPNYYQ